MNIFNEYMGGLKIYLLGDAVKCRSSSVEAAVVAVMSNVDRPVCRCGGDVECRSSKLRCCGDIV